MSDEDTFTGDEPEVKEDEKAEVKEGPPDPEPEPAKPFLVTLHFDDAPAMELIVTEFEMGTIDYTGKFHSGTPGPTGRYTHGFVVQAQSEPGDFQLIYVDWLKVYAAEVASIEPTRKRRR